MNNQTHLLIAFLLLTLMMSGCKSERKNQGITFVFDKPISEEPSRYPPYFKEIAVPYQAECAEIAIDFLPKPIKVIRLDISKKEVTTNAWYFEDIGDNTVDFTSTWLGEYFKDSIPPSYLSDPVGLEISVESFIKKNQQNSFIYSEESDLKEYLGIPVFNSSTKLVDAMKAHACQNKEEKNYVLVNPEMNEINSKDDPPTNASSNLTSIFNQIGKKELSPDARLAMIGGQLDLFSSDANVKEFGKNGTLVGLTPVKDYFERIAFYRTLEKIEITKTLKNPEGKVWEVRLVEHHLNDPK